MALTSALDLRPGLRVIDRAPICDLDAELGLLGAALFDNSLAARLDRLEPRHFHEVAYGHAWAAIQVIVADGQVADAVTVSAKLGVPEMREILFTAWNRAQVAPAEDYARLITELAQRRTVVAAATAAIECLTMGASSAEVIGDMEAALLEAQKGARRAALVSAAQAAQDVLDYLDAPDGSTAGIETGIPPLDEHLGRLQADELILLAGRTGMGKSALGACIALNVARTGKGVIEVNCEMTTAQMMRRHLSDLAFEANGWDAPTYKDIKRRRISLRQRRMLEEAKELVSALPLYMVKRTGLTLSGLRSMVRRQAALWQAQGVELGLVSLDHVGLLQVDEGGGRDRYADQTAIAIGAKQFADEFHLPLMAMVQLNRKVEDREVKRPMLSDLRDSGAWEENADTVIGAYREAYYALKEPEPKDDGRPGSLLKWQDWDRRKKSKAVEAILLKVREGEEASVPLWASIGHNAIRGADPDDKGGLF